MTEVEATALNTSLSDRRQDRARNQVTIGPEIPAKATFFSSLTPGYAWNFPPLQTHNESTRDPKTPSNRRARSRISFSRCCTDLEYEETTMELSLRRWLDFT